jgi:hypothetical protein
MDMSWHDIRKEKPKRGDDCLVVAGGTVQFMALTWNGSEFEWADGYLHGDSAFDPFPSEDATHWMLLPEYPGT